MIEYNRSEIWLEIYILCLEEAAQDTHTLYHSRIDGTLIPYCTD